MAGIYDENPLSTRRTASRVRLSVRSISATRLRPERNLPSPDGIILTEPTMGSKASNFFQSDRPESGGADKDMQREKSGLLEIDKERFAAEQQEREASRKEEDVRKGK